MDHQEKCKKYKRQIEDLKLDNMELLEVIEVLKEKLRALNVPKSQWRL